MSRTPLRRLLCAIALALAALGAAAGRLTAQNPPRPTAVQRDSMATEMAGMATSLTPMMQQMMTAQLTATLQFYAKPETAELMAQVARNYYLALMRQGFTAEQALVIVAASKPVAPPSPR